MTAAATARTGDIWLDPDNAKAIVAYLAKALSARSPADAAKINANAAKLAARIDALTADIESETRPLRGKPFVVFHDAFRVFRDAVRPRCGGVHHGEPAGSAERQAVARAAREDPLAQRRLRVRGAGGAAEPLTAVTEGTQARSGMLDAEGLTLRPRSRPLLRADAQSRVRAQVVPRAHAPRKELGRIS